MTNSLCSLYPPLESQPDLLDHSVLCSDEEAVDSTMYTVRCKRVALPFCRQGEPVKHYRPALQLAANCRPGGGHGLAPLRMASMGSTTQKIRSARSRIPTPKVENPPNSSLAKQQSMAKPCDSDARLPSTSFNWRIETNNRKSAAAAFVGNVCILLCIGNAYMVLLVLLTNLQPVASGQLHSTARSVAGPATAAVERQVSYISSWGHAGDAESPGHQG